MFHVFAIMRPMNTMRQKMVRGILSLFSQTHGGFLLPRCQVILWSNSQLLMPIQPGLCSSESQEDNVRAIGSISGVSEKICSYREVLNHLDLNKTSELYLMTRPVKDYKQPTWVSLEVRLYAILDVVEKEQKFIPYVWTVMAWQNEYISWNPDDFCGIKKISIPTNILWKPDVAIEEMTEKDKAPPSPYLFIDSNGTVEVQNNHVLVSTCRMRVHKFPFDTQSCNLTFKSAIHTDKDIRLHASDNSSEATEWSRDLMRTQYEWLFINMTVTTKNASLPENQDVIIYTINMKRRPLLYIVNFLLPVLFFLCLDLASFMISHGSGEKLTFKVTVLLAVTVLQLILNEILPASSDRIPLIAMYCIGNFALMLISLLETIVVMYLMKKDSHQENETDATGCLIEDGKNNINIFDRGKTNNTCIYNVSTGESPSGLLNQEDESSKLTDEYHTLERLSDELKKVEKKLSLPHTGLQRGYWTTVAKTFNKIFFIFYVLLIIAFLSFIFSQWRID
ncbi:5-hydroxytryptamine receptor 3A-like isoform X2 [Sphaeramia orbicularis]|uniref:5-hydroxytryptamine receptor 3A-like n=1 Tax=Sphaeramia orbicularis TaxID=375764 RepID=A0A673ATB6_9TELE|nr:5-hydroxytryptamine receptor 3A-like isoform X2 [Sphaeramia orbicularis]